MKYLTAIKALAILGLMALLMTGAANAYDINECVVLEEYEGCVVFYPDFPHVPTLLTDYGGFQVGDTVRVKGDYDIDPGQCGSVFLNQLIVASIDSCRWEVDGELITWGGCFVLNDHKFNLYILSDYGGFQEGDWVTVGGELTGQTSPCGWEAEHVEVATIVAGPALSCCSGLVDGNVNQDPGGAVDLSDLMVLVNYLFLGGTSGCPAEGDRNCDGVIDLTDLIRFVQFLFNQDFPPAPMECPCVDL